MLENMESQKIEVLELSDGGRYGKFVFGPLEHGYANTIGNSLRRVLLSSLPGVAVTSVKIDGVQHEFSTVPNVAEDVTEIILNVKGIIAKMYGEVSKTGYIDAKGEGEVTTADIKVDSEVEIIDKDIHIATLAEGAELKMELVFDCGRGYVSSEKNKSKDSPIGTIAVDSIYTPVRKANYFVTNQLVGSRADYERLTLEVWTDGTVSAQDAVAYAAKLLIKHLAFFSELAEESHLPEIMAEREDKLRHRTLEMSIDDLELSVRSANCLRRAGITVVGDLVKLSVDDMLKVRNLGKKSFDEVRDRLYQLGFEFAPSAEFV
ncbi:MAG: DNA-directed RNA polymerase subunit alpha [Oscillospiraceae bacterium]|jgi:DNA-directed RNA polymerase subunit alpha|nr:DNA-directed RNA polymerase subunit alpha [Oscillospiraceae bacterium]